MTDLNCNKTNEDTKENKESKITDTVKMEKRQKHIIVIEKESLAIVCNEIRETMNFKFLLASTDEKYVYIFVVFLRRESIDSKYVLFSIKPFTKYMENVEFIWKRGRLLKNINCNLWQDNQVNQKLKAKDVLDLSDESAREQLDIKEYYIYRKFRTINK